MRVKIDVCVKLCGPAACGKTRLANILLEHLKKLGLQCYYDEERHIINVTGLTMKI
jgi:adenylylsulfate kinase-like enzyme